MDLEEIAPHLLHWTAPHPGWKPKNRGKSGLGWDQIVSSYAVITDHARLCPDSWLPKGKTRDDLAAAIRPLLEGKELLLLTHGGPRDATELEV